jgi:hypothetical protein
MQPCLFEDLTGIYVTPTPKGLARAEKRGVVLID